VSRRLFGTLEASGINVVLIAQASSEHSITLAISERDADDAKRVLHDVFSRELKLKHISDITIEKPCSIIAAVGDGMSDTTGVAGKFFSALGESKVSERRVLPSKRREIFSPVSSQPLADQRLDHRAGLQ
jgi:aspartokinase/homoserine dehydrogenase 1